MEFHRAGFLGWAESKHDYSRGTLVVSGRDLAASSRSTNADAANHSSPNRRLTTTRWTDTNAWKVSNCAANPIFTTLGLLSAKRWEISRSKRAEIKHRIISMNLVDSLSMRAIIRDSLFQILFVVGHSFAAMAQWAKGKIVEAESALKSLIQVHLLFIINIG